MDYEGIKEVREFAGQASANAYLIAGWVLLNTYTRTNDNPNDQFAMYCLGWPKDLPAVYPDR